MNPYTLKVIGSIFLICAFVGFGHINGYGAGFSSTKISPQLSEKLAIFQNPVSTDTNFINSLSGIKSMMEKPGTLGALISVRQTRGLIYACTPIDGGGIFCKWVYPDPELRGDQLRGL